MIDKIKKMLFGKKDKSDPLALTDLRVLFVKNGCPHCRKWLGVVEKVNTMLSPDRRIQKVWVDMPGQLKYAVQIKGTPTLYIDGEVVEGLTTPNFGMGFLLGFLKVNDTGGML